MADKTVTLWEGLKIHRKMMQAPALDRIGRLAAYAFGPKDGDGVALTSISHPANPGALRGRRLKKASLETVEIEVKDG